MPQKIIGITTTIPIEIIYAAEAIPIDLNNVFITHPSAYNLVEKAEYRGFNRNICAWIKGIYSVTKELVNPDFIVGVSEGDCSESISLMEIFSHEGIKIIPFAYPFDGDEKKLKNELKQLSNFFGVTLDKAEQKRKEFGNIRKLAEKIDILNWKENKVRGFENHYYLVNMSDFKGNPEKYTLEMKNFIAKAEKRKPFPESIRLGYIGVPPIFSDIYETLEKSGARVVFNEIQRQFSMPFTSKNIIEQYLNYTYPYDIFKRVRDILTEIERRKIKGIIHYVQSFCHRYIEELIFKELIPIPYLVIEGDRPGEVDAKNRTKIEAFLEIISRRG